MKAYVNEIRGLADAICTLFLSKRNLEREKEMYIRSVVTAMTDSLDGRFSDKIIDNFTYEQFEKYKASLLKYGVKHTTLLRYIDFSCSVYGLHRGAQDDFDAHAKRLENRIVRSSTRLAKFGPGEKSDYYKGKIITTDELLEIMEIELPNTIKDGDITYIRTVNGYVIEGSENDNDVLRGLYMLSIPSNFIFKCNIVEFAHIVVMRDKNSHAAPELKDMIEQILDQLYDMTNGMITRELLYEIERYNSAME